MDRESNIRTWKMVELEDFVSLANKLGTHPANAKVCWEAWLDTRITNFGVPEKGLNAFQNRLIHFSSQTGMRSTKAVAFCRLFAALEQQMFPECATQGIPGNSAAVPLSSLAKSETIEVVVPMLEPETVEANVIPTKKRRWRADKVTSTDIEVLNKVD